MESSISPAPARIPIERRCVLVEADEPEPGTLLRGAAPPADRKALLVEALAVAILCVLVEELAELR
jgi:hypothetical protein